MARSIARDAARRRVGHSAGGHLTAAILATPSPRLQFDPARIVGGVPISGIFDFEPLRRHSFNADFLLDADAVKRLDLHTRAATCAAPLVVAVGGSESSEFIRQSRLLAHAWRGHLKSLLVLPGYNHFSVVDAFAERGQPLHQRRWPPLVDRILATYRIAASESESRARAEALAVEQSVEMPVSAIGDADIVRDVVATVESIRPHAGEFEVVLASRHRPRDARPRSS
jgi:acetyl esterase/lipase